MHRRLLVLVALLASLLLAAGCASSTPKQYAQQALTQNQRLVAAINQQNTEAYTTAMSKLRPPVNKLIKALESGDPTLANQVRNPFMRLEAGSQAASRDWDGLLREAVLLRTVLQQVAASE